MKKVSKVFVLLIVLLVCVATSCRKRYVKKEEQLTLSEHQRLNDTTGISVQNDSASLSFLSSPNTVLLTGLDRIRLILIYKVGAKSDRNIDYDPGTTFYDYYSEDETKPEDFFKYFMPGIDLIYGYNLVNIGHYDLVRDSLSYFFDNPVLIRTLYFPGLKKDSVNYQPVSRNYFMVSVYDEDTNQDSLINKKDLRRFYHIDQFNFRRTRLIPPDFSVIRSTYDYKNDVMYIYARYDANRNGLAEKSEPVSIFCIRLNDPTIAKRIL